MMPLLFGLRTGVGSVLPGDCGVDTRAKQGSLLFDRLLFEGGSLDLRVEGTAVVERWLRPLPPGAGPLRVAERLADDRVPGGPVVSFDALLETLRVLDVDWVGVVVPPPDAEAQALAPAIGDPSDRVASSSWLGVALDRDLAVARQLESTLVAAPFFSTLIFPDEDPPPLARGVVSPDLSALSWEDVLALREHSSVRAVRRLMREITALADLKDPEPMLHTFDVLAEDISVLLSDAIEPLAGELTRLIVTRLAVPHGDTGPGPPLVLIESHDVGDARP